MTPMKKWTFAAATVGFVAFGAFAGMAQDKMKAVEDRQALMKSFGADNKAIADYSKGAGDKDKAQAGIADMLAKADRIDSLFPAGTSSADFPGKSKAKPEIWTDHAGFLKDIAALKDAETKLSDAIKTGTPADVTTAMAPVGRTGCGACHNTYREKENPA